MLWNFDIPKLSRESLGRKPIESASHTKDYLYFTDTQKPMLQRGTLLMDIL